MDQPAFAMIKVPAERSMAKPRRTGLTMMIDWDRPLGQQADYLDMSGRFIDLAKIAVGSVRVYGEQQLRRKIALYKDHGVRCFVGDGRPKSELIAALREGLDFSRALFELPGPWISGVNASQVQDLKKFLIGEFGPDVSIGSIMPEEIFETEMSRQGMGVVQPTRVAWR